MNPDIMQALLQAQENAFHKEGMVTYATRIERIDRCIALLVDHQKRICAAVNEDFGSRSHHTTLMMDIYTSINAAKFVKKHLKQWMRPVRRSAAFPLNLMGAKARIHYEPKGVVGLMTPWNVPISMILTPLVDILGAGNRCLIKPSEHTTTTSALLQELFANYFDATEIAVVNGNASVGAAFSELAFDHLIFTGATSIGQKVMSAAAKNLTPVTLELGGKSPAIVSHSANIDDAISKLIIGKCMNAGQLCVSPDYAFVPESSLESVIQLFEQTMKQHYPSIIDNPDWVSMIHHHHAQRIASYIDDAESKGARIIELNPSKERWKNHSRHKIPLHLIINPTDDMLVMQDEIFGPILSLKTYTQIDDAVKYINQHEKPLALYYFGNDKKESHTVLSSTSSGGVTINDCLAHVGCDDIPFGGIGKSGIGHYHGLEGFKTFSHSKSVFHQSPINSAKLAGILPPYSNNIDKLMSHTIKK